MSGKVIPLSWVCCGGPPGSGAGGWAPAGTAGEPGTPAGGAPTAAADRGRSWASAPSSVRWGQHASRSCREEGAGCGAQCFGHQGRLGPGTLFLVAPTTGLAGGLCGPMAHPMPPPARTLFFWGLLGAGGSGQGCLLPGPCSLCGGCPPLTRWVARAPVGHQAPCCRLTDS